MKPPVQLTIKPREFIVAFVFVFAMIATWLLLLGVVQDFFSMPMVVPFVLTLVAATGLSALLAFAGCAIREMLRMLVRRRLQWRDFLLPGGLALVLLFIFFFYAVAPVIAMTLEILFWTGLLAAYLLTRIPKWLTKKHE
jgi:hypothetical protein